MRSLDLIIIHCSATPNGRTNTVADINDWHKKRGFAMIGYHYVIYIDGSVHIGRPVAQSGAHASGYNAHSIGICLVGTDEFTIPQWEALKGLVNRLMDQYKITTVLGHRGLPRVQKYCPGFNVYDWLKSGENPLENHILNI